MIAHDPDEFTPQGRPSRYDDVRADYDDDFAVPRSAPASARQKVVGPAVAFVVIGVFGIAGMGVAAFAVVLNYTAAGRWGNPLLLGLFLWLLFVAACLFATVIAGGLTLMRFRRRWLALTAAYIVTGLSVGGVYGILFFPFGIWALVVLYQPDVRDQFRRPPDPVRDPDARLR